MRSSGRMSLATLMAMASIAGMGAVAEAMPAPRKGSSRDSKPRPPRRTTSSAAAREVAEWNAAVEQRKQAKRAAKLARKEREQ